MGFVSLHNHSIYSLLDGLVPPENMVRKAKELGMSALAITDHGSMSGCIKFYKEAKKIGVKPILGIEAYFVDNATTKQKGEKRYHIILLAKSEKGFYSLMNLMSKAHQNFYYNPRIDLDMLIETEDIIVTTACMTGLLLHPSYEKLCLKLKDHFKDDFYLEMMPLDMEEQEEINKRAEFLRVKYDLPVIITNDVHYLNREDRSTHQLLLKINTKNPNFSSPIGLHLRTEESLLEASERIMSYIPKDIIQEAIRNTSRIADKVNIELKEKKLYLPSFSALEPHLVLDRIVKDRYENLYKDKTEESLERMNYELSVIKNKDFSTYFITVFNLIKHARKNDIELNAGRGSSAGSFVCYLLGITELDPIKEDLMFERFLNPERTDYPDIDIDFPTTKRSMILEYLSEEFGEDNVSNITTFSRLKPKSAFKDVAKEYGLPFFEANNITKMLDDERTIAEQVKEDETLNRLVSRIPKHEEVIKHSDKLCGTLRQLGTHAAGVVIASEKVKSFGIIEKRKGDFSLNWDMEDISFFGLVKLDILGLTALDIISDAKKLIGKKITWEDVNTQEILDEFGKGNTVGIFQFHSPLMRHLLRSLERIDGKNVLVDANALGRPGPLDSKMTEEYIVAHQKNEMASERPYTKYIEGIVNDTRGVIIYQEQVIKILAQAAGYSVSQADVVRRAIAKSKGEEAVMEHLKAFVEGCVDTSGMSESVATNLFDDIAKFGRYGFNKSHAAAYTELALRQMYLKVNHPIEYLASLYKHFDTKEKKASVTREMKRLGVELLEPDINLSYKDFTVEEGGIRIGLSAIMNVGEKAIEEILKQRKSNPYNSIEDFRLRVAKRTVNKRVFENLIKVGSFDMLGINQKKAVEAEEYFKKVVFSNGTNEGLYDSDGDYINMAKEKNKLVLMPGIYSLDIEPETGLTLDDDRLNLLTSVVKSCKICSMFKYYRRPVPFEYGDGSRAMIIAEAPGFNEWEEGKPLVGKAGRFFNNEMKAVGIDREDLYLTNVFKCRPFENKLPTNPPKDCYSFLKKEIKIIQPKLILAMGNRALEFFTGSNSGIMSKSGSLEVYTEVVDDTLVPVIYCIHPSAVIRDPLREKGELFTAAIEFFATKFFG